MPRLFSSTLSSAIVLSACVFAALLTGCASSHSARQSLYVACATGKQILVYEIDTETGGLTEVQRLELPGKVGPLAITDDRKTLYAAINNPPRIVPMQRDTDTGELSMLTPTAVPSFPTYLDIDATGQFAITASYGAGLVHTFKINPDRTLDATPIQETRTAKTAHASLIDPSNRFVYVPHTKPNAIYQFRFSADTGKIAPIPPIVIKGGGLPDVPAGPRHYTYHPTLGVMYVVNELNSSVSAYAWDKQTGQIARFQSLTTLPAGYTEANTCADIHITPDGRFLYASNRGHNTIAAYALSNEGQMEFIDWFKTEAVPREFEIDLNGQYLYSAGLRTDKLVAYAIDARTGRLNPIGMHDTPAGPIWVTAVELD